MSHRISSLLAGLGLLFCLSAQATTYVPIAVGDITVIIPIDDPPVAVGDSFTVQEDTPTVLDVLANDSDESLSTVSVRVVSSVSQGILIVNADNQTLSYTPGSNYSGADSFSYEIVDEHANTSATVTVALTIEAVNDTPTISNISNRTIDEDNSTGNISFTVSDIETAASALTVTKTSSNNNLIPASNISLNGSGTTRTVNITPAADQSGTATITLTVSDGNQSASESFVVTVNAVNDAPTISNISNKTIDEDNSTGNISFTVSDVETSASALTVTKASSNNSLIPASNISLSGSGTTRTVNITPAADQSGTATITLTVSNGNQSASESFVVTVNAVNDTPTISNISNRTIDENTSTGSINFTISDVETVSSSLAVNKSSSNTSLVPTSNIVISGSGASKTVNVTPSVNRSGTTTITLTVSDGDLSTSESFVLTVLDVFENSLPQITSSAPPGTIQVGQQYSYDTNATDPDGDSITFGISNKPAWATFNVNSGILTGAPTNSDVAVYDSIQITANDGNGGIATMPPFSITVTEEAPPEQQDWAETGGSLDDHGTSDATPTENSDYFGSIAYSADTVGGAATYNIPIAIAPGRNNMQPNIAINYSSRSGNGVAGVGWSISGTSKVHRCSATLAQDGLNKSVTYATTDKLCLDGLRLMTVPGSASYGTNGAEYRTEQDRFIKVVQSGGDINSTTTSFKAYYKDGTVKHYGFTSDSKQSDSGTSLIKTWALSYTVDTAGNAMQYSYITAGPGEHLLSEINYTGYYDTAEETYTAGNRSVSFGYDNRPDIRSQYLAGAFSREIKRLETITPKYNGTAIRTYSLDYITSDATGRSLLDNVTACALSQTVVGSNCQTVTQFSWQNAEIQYEVEAITFNPESTAPLTPYAGEDFVYIDQILPNKDANRDGVLDWPSAYISAVESGSFRQIEYTTGYFTDAEGRTTGTHAVTREECKPRHVIPGHRAAVYAGYVCFEADFNQDGVVDNWRIENRQLKLLLIDPSDQSATTIDSINMPDSKFPVLQDAIFGFSDMNGDGWPDLLVKDKESGQQLVAYFHTRNIQSPYISSASQAIFHYDLHYLNFDNNRTRYSYPYITNNEPMLVGDLDGNGLADIVNLEINSNELQFGGYGAPKLSSVRLTESATSNSITQISNGFGVYGSTRWFHFIDVNGDGLSDLITWRISGEFYLQLNKGRNVSEELPLLRFTAPIEIPGINWDATYYDTREFVVDDRRGIVERHFVPKMMHAFKVMDINMDGKQEFLFPGDRVIEGCAWVAQGSVSNPVIEICGDRFYENIVVNQSTGSTVLPEYWLDRSVHKYTAIYFNEDANGSMTFDVQDSGIVSTLYESAAIDAFGDGLTDNIFINGVGKYDCTNSPGCMSIGVPSADSGLPANIGNGGYINRNRGSATGNQRYAKPDTLIAVDNGAGQSTSWTYKPLTSGDTDNSGNALYQTDDEYVFGAGADDSDYFHFSSNMPVVAEMSTSDGIGGTNITNYRYRGAVYNNEGRGFQGFRTVIVDDLSSGLRSVTDFHQKYPLSGKPENTRTCLITENDETCSIQLPIQSNEFGYITIDTQGDSQYSTDTILSGSAIIPPIHFLFNAATVKTTRAIEDRSQIIGQITQKLGSTTDISDLNTLAPDSSTYDVYGNTLELYTLTNSGFATTSSLVTSEYIDPADLTEATWWVNKLDSQVTRFETTSNTSSHYDTAADPIKEIKTSYTWNDELRKPDVVTTEALQGGGKTRIVDYDYNDYGLITSESHGASTTDTNKRTSSFLYSSDGMTLADDGYFPHTLSNAKNHLTIQHTAPAFGVITYLSDPNDIAVNNYYDSFGRIKRTESAGNRPVYYRYYSCDCTDFTLAEYRVEIHQDGAPKQITYFDALQREIAATTEGFSGSDVIYQIKTYDNRGNTTFEGVPSHNKSIASQTGNHFSNFDALGRPGNRQLDTADAQTMSISYSYTGHTVNITATSDKTLTMSRTYDSVGKLMSTSDAAQNPTSYVYDAMQNPIAIVDSDSNIIEAEYNALGQKLSVNDPNMGDKSFTYTVFGEVETELDANQDTLKYAYDKLGRIIHRYEKLNGATTYTQVASFTYDNCTDGIGALCSDSGSGKSRTLSYDSLGRLAQESITLPDEATPFVSQFQYDSAFNRLKTVSYPVTDLTIGFEYNDNGYVEKLVNAQSGYIYQHVTGRNAYNNITGASIGNSTGIHSANYFPESGQMENLSIRTSGNNLNLSYDYEYDGFGNLERQDVNVFREGEIKNAWEIFTYDNLHRLTSTTRTLANGLPSGSSLTLDDVAYHYNGIGNIKKKTDYSANNNDAFLYGNSARNEGGNAGPNAVRQITLASGGVINYQYDNNGNRTHVNGLQQATYNVYNKPTVLSTSGVTSTFTYGADLARFKQRVTGLPEGDKTTLYIRPDFEKVTQGNVTKYRHYIGDVAIYTQTVENSDTEHEIGFTHRDRSTSIVAITDHQANLVEARSYDAFGKPRMPEFADIYPSTLTSVVNEANFSLVTNRGFTDHEHLDEHQLIHMNGRVYDYNTGRFLSVDPYIQSPDNSQSLNPYSYIMNNPLSGIDPTGYRSICEQGRGDKCVTYTAASDIEKLASYVSESGSEVSNAFNPKASEKTEKTDSTTQLGNGENNEEATIENSPTLNSSPRFSADAGFMSWLYSWIAPGAVEIYNHQADNTPACTNDCITAEQAENNIAVTDLLGAAGFGKAESVANAAANVAMARKAVSKDVTNSGVWKLKPTDRGNAIEAALAKTDYKDWFNVGELNKGYFPLVDFQKGNTLVSLKSVDTTGSTWMGRMTSHIDDLATRGATVNGQKANMVLDLRVQAGGAKDAASLVQYGRQQGINVVVKEF